MVRLFVDSHNKWIEWHALGNVIHKLSHCFGHWNALRFTLNAKALCYHLLLR